MGDQRPGQVGAVGDRVVVGPRRRVPAVRPRRGRWGRPRPPAGAARPSMGMSTGVASSGRADRGHRDRRGGSTSGVDGVEQDAHRGAPTVALAHGDHRGGERPPSWVTSTSNQSGRSSSTARLKTAWAERTVWSGQGLRGGHHGLGQQLAAVDHPTVPAVAARRYRAGAVRRPRRRPRASRPRSSPADRRAGAGLTGPTPPGPPPRPAPRRRPGRRRRSRPGGPPRDRGRA